MTFSKEVVEELKNEHGLKQIAGDATTAIYVYMPAAGWEGHITNIPDALSALYLKGYMTQHPDGTITTGLTNALEPMPVTGEVFWKLKRDGRIRFVGEVYKFVNMKHEMVEVIDEVKRTGLPLPAVDVVLIRQAWEMIRANNNNVMDIARRVGAIAFIRTAALNDLFLTHNFEVSNEVMEKAAVFPWCNTSKLEDFVRHLKNKKGC